jgi:hypothetical protein
MKKEILHGAGLTAFTMKKILIIIGAIMLAIGFIGTIPLVLL